MAKPAYYSIDITPFNLTMVGIEGANLITKVVHLSDSYIINKKIDFNTLNNSILKITNNINFQKNDKINIGLPNFSTLRSLINIGEDLSNTELKLLSNWMADFFLVSPPKAFNYYINKIHIISDTYLEFFFMRKIILNNITKIANKFDLNLSGIYPTYQKIIEKILNKFVEKNNNFILIIANEHYIELILWYNNRIDKITNCEYQDPKHFFDSLYEEILNLETNINLIDLIILIGIIPNKESNILKIKTNFGLNVHYISYKDLNFKFSNYLEEKIPEEQRDIFITTLFITD